MILNEIKKLKGIGKNTESLETQLKNNNKKIYDNRQKLKNDIITQTQNTINKEINQLQKDDFRSIKYYKKIKRQQRMRDPKEANFVYDENKVRIE